VIAAIAHGKRPARMARKDAVVYEFFMALERRRSVGDATHRRAVAALGEAGVIDLIGVIGYYTTLAMILNVARTPPPKGAPRLRAAQARSARGVPRAASLRSRRRIQAARHNTIPR
jgi:4-carboxymuconolactone decarboxylase